MNNLNRIFLGLLATWGVLGSSSVLAEEEGEDASAEQVLNLVRPDNIIRLGGGISMATPPALVNIRDEPKGASYRVWGSIL